MDSKELLCINAVRLKEWTLFSKDIFVYILLNYFSKREKVIIIIYSIMNYEILGKILIESTLYLILILVYVSFEK